MCLLEQVICICSNNGSSMSFQQPAGGHSSSKSQRKTRFTIDSILDTSPPSPHVTDDKSSFVVSSVDELASATGHNDSGGKMSLPLCSGTEHQRPDEEHSQTRIDHIDDELERVDEVSEADAETGQRRAQCSSLLAQTAASFHRRHVAQLRSFSELFFAQYQQYRRQLRNHFHHHSAQQPSTVNVLPVPLPPPPARSLSGLEYRRRPPDVVHSTLNALQCSLHDHGSQLRTTSSTSVQPRTSRSTSNAVDWSPVDQQSLPLTQLGRFVDGSNVHHATTPEMSTALGSVYNDTEAHDEYSAVGCSSDRNRTKWTASNNFGISSFLHAHIQ